MVSIVSPVGAMLPPPTPIAKQRPTFSFKRDSSYLDTDDEAGLSQSTKKLKVSFDERIDVRVLDDWNEKSFELIKEEVRLGIERHVAPEADKDDGQYLKLLQCLSLNAQSGEILHSDMLRKYILALESRMSLLSECGKLVIAILDISWLGRDESFVELYGRFLILLASAHSKYIPPMMERLVQHFLRLPASQGRLPEEAPVTRAAMFNRLHATVQRIVQRVPSASSILLRALKLQFPYDLSSNKSYIQYQTHLLRLAETATQLQSDVMALVTQRLVALDTQIQRELDDLDLDEDEKLTPDRPSDDRFGTGYESDDSDAESASESELTMTDEEQRLKDIRMKVSKMDSTLDLLFHYYEPLLLANQYPEKNAYFQQLISNFDNYILPNRTRHAQFIIFHFAQTSPDYAKYFINHCKTMTNDRNNPMSTRLIACSYVASFTARGHHISASLVRDVMSWLCGYLEACRIFFEAKCVGPDRRSYALYYGVSQAIFYVFCFRWRDLVCGVDADIKNDGQDEEELIAEGHDLIWTQGLKTAITVNVRSPLNPLKVCSPAIVGEFARIANHLRFVYIFSLLETNKRIRLGRSRALKADVGNIDLGRRETAFDRKSGDAHLQLEAYFPFDPYLLRQSKKWLDGDYNEWKLPRGMSEDDEADDEDDDEEDGEGEDDEVTHGYDESEDEGIYDSEDDDLPVLPTRATVAAV